MAKDAKKDGAKKKGPSSSDGAKKTQRKRPKITSSGKSANTRVRSKRDRKRGRKISRGQG